MTYREPEAAALLFASFGKGVHALDSTTGEIVWSNQDCGRAAGGALIHRDGRLFLAGWGEAHALNARTGKLLWSLTLEAKVRCGLILEGDRLFVASNGVVACIHVSGKLLWQNEFRGLGYGCVAFAIGDQFARDDRDS